MNFVNVASVDCGAGGGGAVVCEVDGVGVGRVGAVVGLAEADGVALARGLDVPAASGVPCPLTNRTTNRITASSSTPPMIPRTRGRRDLRFGSLGEVGGVCASKRSVGVSSLIFRVLARISRGTP